MFAIRLRPRVDAFYDGVVVLRERIRNNIETRYMF